MRTILCSEKTEGSIVGKLIFKSGCANTFTVKINYHLFNNVGKIE
jgi:hypothetical protein